MSGTAILIALGVAFLLAAGVLWVALRPARREAPPAPAEPFPATAAPVGARFWWVPQALFFGLFAVCAVCFLMLPAGGVDPRAANFQKPLPELVNDPHAAQTLGLLALAMGSFLLMPVVEICGFANRGISAPWAPTSAVWSRGGRPWTGYPLAVVVAGAVGAVAWFSVALGLFAAVIGYCVWLGWLQRRWIAVDEVGVVLSGFRFRWDQVTAWDVVFHPGEGGEDGFSDWYELVFELTDGTKRTRDDTWDGQRLSEFFARHAPAPSRSRL